MEIEMEFDEESERRLQDLMRERGISFNAAVNEVIRAGLANSAGVQDTYLQKTFAMGTPSRNMDKALKIAGDLEDEELIRRMDLDDRY